MTLWNWRHIRPSRCGVLVLPRALSRFWFWRRGTKHGAWRLILLAGVTVTGGLNLRHAYKTSRTAEYLTWWRGSINLHERFSWLINSLRNKHWHSGSLTWLEQGFSQILRKCWPYALINAASEIDTHKQNKEEEACCWRRPLQWERMRKAWAGALAEMVLIFLVQPSWCCGNAGSIENVWFDLLR